ncbi:ATP-dependent endonuclease [Streptomyces sp. NPDC058220]|uniref:ATP-dependent nuclease n=1 Tax=Streptomyces sp. NPDC058220 TaxID=3346387 RepID=UPI0036EBD2F2
MKIASLLVRNFKGVREFSVEEVSKNPLVILAGKNGSGKSTLFHAVSLAWTGPESSTNYSELVGPWGGHAEIMITFTLTEYERRQISTFQSEAPEDALNCPQVITMHFSFNKKNEHRWPTEDHWPDVLRNATFQKENSFASLDIIPAERSVARDSSVRIDPSLLEHDAIDRIRAEAISSLMDDWSRFTLSDVPQYLTSLDYLDLIAERKGESRNEGRSSDFEFITENFYRATGKRINRPDLLRDGTVSLSIETPSGNRHTVGKLSSGELECLGLMYMARRIAAKGGVLLLDEPELHLHPALQTTITSAIQEGMQNAQMWLCTHSPSLINSASLDSLINVKPAAAQEENQAEKISEQSTRLEIMAELGMHPSATLQYDRMVIVEGETDRKYLQTLFPLETARSLVYVAGNKSAVLSMSKTLEKNEQLFPWVAICDRDLVDSTAATGGRLWVWSRRMIENCFLEGSVLSAAMGLVGPPLSPTEVEEKLREIADSEKEDISRLLIEETVKERVGAAISLKVDKHDIGSYFEREKLRAVESLTILDDVTREVNGKLDSVWDESWKELANGKRVLANFLKFTPFRGFQNLMDAICTAIALRPEVEPADIRKLREVLIEAGF